MNIYKRNYYRKKRLKKGLSMSEVANALNIDCAKYELIDRGKVKMPKNLIDKFNEIINKGKGEHIIAKLNREELVNKWWDEMSTKTSYGKYKLNEKMKEFNIDTLIELSNLLGWKSQAGICNYLSGKIPITFNTKNKIYSFFENELNIQPPKNNKTKKNKTYTIYKKTMDLNEIQNLYNWYDGFDIVEWAQQNNLKRDDISTGTGLASGTISNLYRNIFAQPTVNTLMKLKSFVDKLDKQKNNEITIVSGPVGTKMTLSSVPIKEVPEDIKKIGEDLVKEVNENMKLKEKLIETYKNKLEGLEETITNYKQKLTELEIQKDVYQDLLETIQDEDI